MQIYKTKTRDEEDLIDEAFEESYAGEKLLPKTAKWTFEDFVTKFLIDKSDWPISGLVECERLDYFRIDLHLIDNSKLGDFLEDVKEDLKYFKCFALNDVVILYWEIAEYGDDEKQSLIINYFLVDDIEELFKKALTK